MQCTIQLSLATHDTTAGVCIIYSKVLATAWLSLSPEGGNKEVERKLKGCSECTNYKQFERLLC